ncbi:MAG TPA: aldo/keto reductase [Devosiaceae bacterium]
MPEKRELGRRPVGRTHIEVSELGLGGASLAGIFTAVPDQQARDTVEAALRSGISYFDTAPQYGLGRSEHMVGDALRGKRTGTVLSTKVGRLLKPCFDPSEQGVAWGNPFPFKQVYDYSHDAIMRSFEDSLQRLGLNRVDMLYVHDIGTMTHGDDNDAHWKALSESGYKALDRLRAEGTVGAIGLGVNEWEVLMDAFEIGDWDVHLLAGRYTLLEQAALSPFMETCLKKDVSIVIGGPYNSGILVGGSTWNYAKAPPEIVERVARLENVCRDHGIPLPAAALQFPLTHPAVASVIPGPRSPEELAQTLEWWDTPIAESFWRDLAEAGLLAPGTPLPGGGTA